MNDIEGDAAQSRLVDNNVRGGAAGCVEAVAEQDDDATFARIRTGDVESADGDGGRVKDGRALIAAG
jgi:hypothetical protein